MQIVGVIGDIKKVHGVQDVDDGAIAMLRRDFAIDEVVQ